MLFLVSALDASRCGNDMSMETKHCEIGPKNLDKNLNVKTTYNNDRVFETTDCQIGPKSLEKDPDVKTELDDGLDICNETTGKAVLELELEEVAENVMLGDPSNQESLQVKDELAHIELSNADSKGEGSMKTDDQSQCQTLIDFLRTGLENKDKSKEKLKDKLTDNIKDTEKRTDEIDLIKKIIGFYRDMSTVVVDKRSAGYVCDLCNLSVDKKNMINHLFKHNNVLEEALVACKTCDLKLPKAYMVKHDCTRRLPKHVEVSRRDIRYEVALIETKYRWLNFQTPLKCNHCDAVLKTVSECREHLMCRHLSEFHCKFCVNVYQDVYQITSHLKEHTIGKVGLDNLKSCVIGDWRCTQCNKKFQRKSSLSQHIERIHTQFTSKLYRCSLCQRKYRSEAMFNKHVLSHREKYSCNIDQCEAVFSSYRNLRKHRSNFHKDLEMEKDMKSLCSLCGKRFNSGSTLNSHLECTHGLGQPQACNICGKVFKGKKRLAEHKNSHRLNLKYQCELCGVSYKRRSGLFYHKKVYHGGTIQDAFIKFYRCEVCLKRFRYEKTLFHHLLSEGHMTENQTVSKNAIFECPYCNKKFCIRDKLYRHIIGSHKERNPLECEYCWKKFNTQDKLNRHIARSHNQKKQFECEHCGKKFCHKWSLSRHKRKHKKNEDCDQIHKTDKEPRVIMDTQHVELENFESPTGKTQIATGGHNTEVQEQTEERVVKAPGKIDVQGATQEMLVKLQDQLEIEGVTEEITVKPQDHLENQQYKKGVFYQNTLKSQLEWKHSTGQPQACNIGSKVFQGKVGQKLRYKCELCGVSYKQRSGLFQHRKAFHSGSGKHAYVKVYRCEVCSKRFRYEKNLFQHLVSEGHMTENQTVSEEDILECPYCDKKFYLKGKLHKHLSHFHYQGKSQECEYCGKIFHVKGSLSRHRKKHMSFCQLCKKYFRSQIQLNIHIKKNHTVHNTSTKQCEADNQSDNPVVVDNGDCDQIHKEDQESQVIMNLHFVELENESETCKTQISTEDPIIQVQIQSKEMLVQAPDQIEVQAKVEEVLVKPHHQVEVQGATREMLNEPLDQLVVQGKTQETLLKPQDQVEVQGATQEILLKPQDQLENQPVTINTTSGSQFVTVLNGASYISYGEETIQILGPYGTPLNSDSVIQIISEESLSNE